MQQHCARNRMEPPSASAAAAAALSSVPDVKSLVSVGELKCNSLRNSLRRIHDRASSILLFSLQWKDLEDHYCAAEASVKRRAEELEALEGSVFSKLKEAGLWARMLGDRAEAKIRVLEDKLGGLDARERVFGRQVEERLREMEEVERRVACEEAALWEEMRRRGEELDGLFEKASVKEKRMQRRDMDLEFREKLVENVERELEEGMREVGSKERELSLKRKELDEKLDMVRLMEEELVRRGREIALRDEEIQKKLKVVVLKEKMFEDWHEEIESKKKDIDERLKAVRLKEKRLDECYKEVDTEEVSKNYEMKTMELKLIEKRFEERAKQVEEKERENRLTVEADLKIKTKEDTRKGVEEKGKDCGSSMERSTLTKRDTDGEPVKKSTFAEGETMLDGALSCDGKALQIFLIENWGTDGSFRRNVFEIIKASLNPARLVLDALQAFYSSHNERDKAEAKCNIFRKEICLLLLEELRNISPEIGQTEKDEAVKLSLFWYRRMKGDAKIVNFFNLLAAYKLASSYFDDTLLKIVGRVRYSRKMPELCQVLGFTDKIPGFVRDLVKINNLPSAIRFIIVFKLNDVFPVEALINKCIRNSVDAANNKSKSITAQKKKARKRRLAEMIALMECIEEYHFMSKHTERIREIIFSLGGQNPNLESGANRVGKICCSTKLTPSSPDTGPLSVNSVANTTSNVLPNCQLSKQPKVATPAEAGIIIDVANPMHHLSEQQARIGQGETFESKNSQSNELSGKVDRKSLKIIFSGEVDCDKAREKAYKLLHTSPDPAMLVLDALKDNISSELSKGDGSKSGIPLEVCIQLLELLKRFSPAMSQPLYKDAKEFAVTWKSDLKARADDYVGIVCFLLFLSAFKLSSAFDAGEIVGLLDPASWREHVLHTCEILGLKDVIPDFIQRLIETKNWLNAIKYAHTFGMEDKFPLEPLLKDYLAYWENKAGDLSKAHPGSPLVQTNAVEKMLTATGVVIKCVNFYKLESRCLMKDLEARLQQLEKQKAGISMKLKDSNVEHSDCSNIPASKQETVEEPTVTGNSPSSCLNDDAQISANVPSSTKVNVVGISFSASSKDNAQVFADSSTFGKAAAVPGNSPSASSNADARVSSDVATCSKDAESGSAMKTGGKRPRTSAHPDHHPQANPQTKRQAHGHPCWGQNAPTPPYFNPTWRNCSLPLPSCSPVHHPYHPYLLRPPHIPGRMPEVPLHNGWPAPYPYPRNPYDGHHPPHQ